MKKLLLGRLVIAILTTEKKEIVRMSITVIDSIMGSGKSTWAFNFINSNPEKKYLYVTPFIDECARAIHACNARVH